MASPRTTRAPNTFSILLWRREKGASCHRLSRTGTENKSQLMLEAANPTDMNHTRSELLNYMATSSHSDRWRRCHRDHWRCIDAQGSFAAPFGCRRRRRRRRRPGRLGSYLAAQLPAGSENVTKMTEASVRWKNYYRDPPQPNRLIARRCGNNESPRMRGLKFQNELVYNNNNNNSNDNNAGRISWNI